MRNKALILSIILVFFIACNKYLNKEAAMVKALIRHNSLTQRTEQPKLLSKMLLLMFPNENPI